MKYLLSGATVFLNGKFEKLDLSVADGHVFLGDIFSFKHEAVAFDCAGYVIFPGFVDVHVHLREPGFFYKETMETGTMAAAKGGYTAICAMPNLNPVPDSRETLQMELDRIQEGARVRVYPYGAITKGERGEELADMAAMAPFVAAFSDDGRGVQSREMMRRAMETAAGLGKIIAAHCEDNDLLRGGYIHDGEYARAHGHRGICSESEWRPIERDLQLAKETGCAYHVCHVSTKESVQQIREAKAAGLDVTCETAPHYLTLCDRDLQEDGRFKMNPPLRGSEDRDALLQGLLDGTVDMIATDHAPHSAEEKSGGLEKSLMGVVGLETAFPVLYTKLVRERKLPLETLIEKMTFAPAARFGLPSGIADGAVADLTVYDLNRRWRIDPADFASKGRSTPFAGWDVYGKCKMTLVGGEIIWKEK